LRMGFRICGGLSSAALPPEPNLSNTRLPPAALLGSAARGPPYIRSAFSSASNTFAPAVLACCTTSLPHQPAGHRSTASPQCVKRLHSGCTSSLTQHLISNFSSTPCKESAASLTWQSTCLGPPPLHPHRFRPREIHPPSAASHRPPALHPSPPPHLPHLDRSAVTCEQEHKRAATNSQARLELVPYRSHELGAALTSRCELNPSSWPPSAEPAPPP
jgi:hypothetical protein